MDGLMRDLRYTVRTLAKAPAFTLAAVAALALGVAANTAVFSVVDAVLLRPIAAPDPDRVVFFVNTGPQGSFAAASPAKFIHWRAQSAVVQDVSAFNQNVVNYASGGIPEQLRAGRVSADFFRLFGAPVLSGRTFTDEEDQPNGPKVVVLSYGLWTRRFGSDPQIVGRTLAFGGDPYVVVGILGPGFDLDIFQAQPEIWIPFQIDPNTTDQGHYFTAAGRLKPGVTLQQANARLQLSAKEFVEKFPRAIGPKQGFAVERIRDAMVKDVRSTLVVLAGAVSFVLLIACANVAN